MPRVAPQRLLELPAPLLERHEVRALIYASLAAHDQLSMLPEREREVLRDAYLSVSAQNVRHQASTRRALETLQAAGVRAVLFKGAALLITHYGDPGMRAMDDVDVACHPADLDRAVAALVSAGFELLERPGWRTGPNAVHDVRFSDHGCVLELHYRLWHEAGIDGEISGLLTRAVEVPWEGGPVLVPCLADHLYIVLVHAALHGFAGNPLWLVDATLLAEDATDQTWCEVRQLARAGAAPVALEAALDCLRASSLGARLPERVHVAPVRRWLLAWMRPWLQRGETQLGVWPSRLVRPLLFERPADLVRWSLRKAWLWARERASDPNP